MQFATLKHRLVECFKCTLGVLLSSKFHNTRKIYTQELKTYSRRVMRKYW